MTAQRIAALEKQVQRLVHMQTRLLATLGAHEVVTAEELRTIVNEVLEDDRLDVRGADQYWRLLRKYYGAP